MPTATTIFITSVKSASNSNAAEVWRYNAFQALSGMGTVDESTLKIVNMDEVGEINLGTPEGPDHLISLWQNDLMAVTFEAEVEPKTDA